MCSANLLCLWIIDFFYNKYIITKCAYKDIGDLYSISIQIRENTMKNKILLFLALSLTALTPVAHADFLDLCGGILWHSHSEDYYEIFREMLMSDLTGVNSRLTYDTGSYGDYQGWTLLMMAAHKGRYEIAKLLLEKGADTKIKNNDGKSALQIAQAAEHEEVAKLIVEHSKPDSLLEQVLNCIDLAPRALGGIFFDLSGCILWHSASEDSKDNDEIFGKMFMEDTSVVNAVLDSRGGSYADYQGWTLLMMAAHKGCYGIVKLLLENGADATIETNDGKTALQIARIAGHGEIVTLIAQYVGLDSLVDRALEVIVANSGAEEVANIKPLVPAELYERIELAVLKKLVRKK